MELFSFFPPLFQKSWQFNEGTKIFFKNTNSRILDFFRSFSCNMKYEMVFVALSNFNDYFLLYLVCLFVCKQIQMFAYCCKKQGPKCVTPVVQKIEQLRSLSKFIGFSRSVEKKLEQHICYFDKCYGVAKLSIFLVILNHKTAGLISFCLDNID